MTEIAPMPCVGRIAIETPGYSPCDDCQGLRALCGAEQCSKADTPTAAPVRAPVGPQGDRFAEFEAWMIANGAGEKYARDTMKGARRCVQSGVTSSTDVSSETLPGLARSSLSIYRNALKKYEGFLTEAPQPPETVAAIPEVVEAPEPPTAPQERSEEVAPVDDDPCLTCNDNSTYCSSCEHGVATTMTLAQAAALREADEAMRLSDELDREEVLEAAGLSGITMVPADVPDGRPIEYPTVAPRETIAGAVARSEQLLLVDEPAEAAVDAVSDERALLEMMGVLALSMNRLARMLELEHARLNEALVELRRPKVHRIKLTGEALVFEEAPTL